MIKNIKNLKINSVLLDSVEPESGLSISDTLYINTSMDIRRGASSVDGYYLRLFVATTKDCASALDYISQRYNEYLSGRAGLVEQGQYNDFLEVSLEKNSQYLSNAQPFSPFSTNVKFRNLIMNNGVSPYGNGTVIPKGVIIYDMPLGNMVTDINVGKNILHPIKLSLPDRSDSLDQISCYCFVYDNVMAEMFADESEGSFSLTTGMGPVTSVTCRGPKTFYREIYPDKPLVPMEKKEQPQIIAPDKDILLTTSSEDTKVVQKFTDVFDRVSTLFKTPRLSQSYELSKIIKKNNYFTDLWLSRDIEENNRFIFSFDLRSFLEDNSIFPFVYRNEVFGRALLSGGEEISPDELSSVVSVDVVRHKVASQGFSNTNELTSTRVGFPDRTTLGTPVQEIKRIQISLPDSGEDNLSGIHLSCYEGYDRFSIKDIPNNQINESYQYSVRCTVVDNSPIFLRKIIEVIKDKKRTISLMRDAITSNSSTMFGRKPLYNVKTGKITQDINTIMLPIDGVTQNAGDKIREVLSFYQGILDSLSQGNSQFDLVAYYEKTFKSEQGLISPRRLVDIELLMDVGVKFLYDKLVKIYPSDPLGMFDGLGKSKFNLNMSRGVRNNILEAEHRYQDVYTRGKDNNLGVDYIFGSLDNTDSSRISIDYYDNRRIAEFNKYFFQPAGGNVIVPSGDYDNLSYSYMTPRIIKTPSRPILDQLQDVLMFGETNQYNFDRYGQLYSDIITIKGLQKLGMLYPGLSTIGPIQSKNNKLYSDIQALLSDRYSLSLGEVTTSEFSPSMISMGTTKSTIYNVKDGRACGPGAGLSLVESVIGGESETPASDNYLETVNLTIKNQNIQINKTDIDEASRKEEMKDRSIRLPFAILGELTINDRITEVGRMVESTYNSMTTLGKVLGISESNISSMIENPIFSSLPPQLQSMIIIASTPSPLDLDASAGQNNFDARRFTLENATVESKELVSYFDPSKKETKNEDPTYSLVDDPMRNYATFLAMWMNYRQIAIVEYLSGFGNIEPSAEEVHPSSFVGRYKLSKWKPMSSAIVDSLRESGGTLLCRTRSLQAQDYINLISAYITNDQKVELTKYFQNKQEIELPAYNKYFYINNETPQDPGNVESSINTSEVASAAAIPPGTGY